MTINTISAYLTALRQELKGSDTAILQDALYDAEEHLRSALENLRVTQHEITEEAAIPGLIAEYGTPEEIATAYREVEIYTRPVFLPSQASRRKSGFARFFGVFTDPQAWGTLVYLLISLLTGVLYFSWVLVGASTALSFALFIFGLPLAAFFVLSIRGVALVEGRIVEALLGVRMPRRTIFSPANQTWHARLKSQLSDPQTWKMMGYLILQGPLGTVYFLVMVSLISFALVFIGIPVISALGLPVIMINGQTYFAPVAAYPFTIAFGILLAAGSMHLAKWVGGLHGRFAKYMLVGS